MKQIREKDKYSVIAYVWNLKIKQINEYNSTETDSQKTENKPVVTNGEREGGKAVEDLIGMNYYEKKKKEDNDVKQCQFRLLNINVLNTLVMHF